MRRSRRIFRSGSLALGRGGREAMRVTVAIGLIGALVGVMAVLMAVPGTLFGRAPAVAGTITADAQQVAVIDGDTLRLRETVIRLRGIDAPPRGRVCHQPRGADFDCGVAAAEALAGMVRARQVACRLPPERTGRQRLPRRIVRVGWCGPQPRAGDRRLGACRGRHTAAGRRRKRGAQPTPGSVAKRRRRRLLGTPSGHERTPVCCRSEGCACRGVAVVFV